MKTNTLAKNTQQDTKQSPVTPKPARQTPRAFWDSQTSSERLHREARLQTRSGPLRKSRAFLTAMEETSQNNLHPENSIMDWNFSCSWTIQYPVEEKAREDQLTFLLPVGEWRISAIGSEFMPFHLNFMNTHHTQSAPQAAILNINWSLPWLLVGRTVNTDLAIDDITDREWMTEGKKEH